MLNRALIYIVTKDCVIIILLTWEITIISFFWKSNSLCHLILHVNNIVCYKRMFLILEMFDKQGKLNHDRAPWLIEYNHNLMQHN